MRWKSSSGMDLLFKHDRKVGPTWSWTDGGWVYNYLCNQCLSPLKLWVRILIWWGVLDTTLCDKVCLWLATGRWFSMGTPVSSTNKTDCHEIAKILLKVALNIVTLTPLEKFALQRATRDFFKLLFVKTWCKLSYILTATFLHSWRIVRRDCDPKLVNQPYINTS